MTTRPSPTLLLLLGLTASPGLGADGLLPYTDPVVVAEGAELYAEHCASCHGAELQGEPDWQSVKANGRRPAPPHDETGHTWHHPETQLFDLTKRGVAALVGGGYETDMAGFGEILTDDQILAVLAFIKSTWPKRVIETNNRISATR